MAQPVQDNAIYDAVELLKDNGFDGVAKILDPDCTFLLVSWKYV